VNRPSEGPTVSLLEADPDLADAVPAEALEQAHDALQAPTIEIPAGVFSFDSVEDESWPLGLLILSGVLLRQAVAGDVAAAELLGPGDVVVPAADADESEFVNSRASWAALVPARLALIDASLLSRLCAWPSVWGTILRRMAERSSRQAVTQAICHRPRVDARLRGLLWHLAGRWGRVTPAGVVLPLRLTHETLAGLVGAQRPTVSTALKSLADAGEVTRRRDGAWVLLAESQERLSQLQRRNATRLQPALEVILDDADGGRTMADQFDRLQVAWEQQSATVMALRKRTAALRAETEALTERVRQNGASEH
jgi:CRP/FNR family transcriptional regulator, cyclic AMP receptor protein